VYEIIFSDLAKKQFSKLEKQAQEQIGKSIERIKIRPEHFIERLVGQPSYKFRVGDYRLILEIYNDKLVILVVEIGHRKNVYK
jgi:mRNA interferase RelE/StbE